jgi:hypothetical protein
MASCPSNLAEKIFWSLSGDKTTITDLTFEFTVRYLERHIFTFTYTHDG